MIINRPNLVALNATFSGAYQAAIQNVETFSEKITTRVPVSTLKGIYGFAMSTNAVREWVGERMSIAMDAHSYELPHKKFELTFKVPRDHILRDNLGVYTSMFIPTMAEGVKKHPDLQFIKSIIRANPLGFDGRPFFDSAHPTFRVAPAATTYTNDFLLDASTIESLGNELARVRAAMGSIQGEDGIVLSANHKLILTPLAQEMRLRKVTKSSVIPVDGHAYVDNPLVGIFDILPIPELDAVDPTIIYMLDVSKAIKPFIWQVGSNPIFRSFTDDPNNLHAFMADEFVYGIDGDNGGAYEANSGVTLPFLAARCELELPT